MLTYVGNCSNLIDWNKVIKDCENSFPKYIGPSHNRKDNLPGLDSVLDLWDSAGYKLAKEGGTVEWDMFIAGEQFDQKVVDKFCEFVGLEDYRTAWISRIHPGRTTAPHWDVHDDEIELSRLPDPVRYHCHISKPQFGHILTIEDDVLYWQDQGSTYRWPSRKSWHAGGNAGLTAKYLFNIW